MGIHFERGGRCPWECVDLRKRKGKEEGENYTMGSFITLFTIKQTVYSDNNITIVYDTGTLLRQHVSVIL
jgi:hypothetical protein